MQISSGEKIRAERKGRKLKERKNERKENKERKQREEEMGEDRLLPPSFSQCSVDQGVGFVHAPRGRGFSYTCSFFLKGHQWPYSLVPTSGLSFRIVWESLQTICG